MNRSTITAGLGALVLLVSLAACSAASPTPQGNDGTADATGALDARATALLADFDVPAPDSVEDLIGQLESQPVAERPDGLIASVRVDELVLAGNDAELSVPLPDGQFHLSVAPYLTETHECFYHSLTTCAGELADTDLQVTVTDNASDEVYFDGEVTTFNNGYFDLWLPADREITVSISDGEHSAEVPLGTGAEDPTCVTTIQLS